MIIVDKRDKQAKVTLFRDFFSGLSRAYGTYDPVSGQSWQVKEEVTDKIILNHLQGKKPYGVYLLTEDKTRAVAADFDSDDANAPLDFVAAARHYGIPAYIERSKSKGYHVWIFFENDGVLAAKARLVVGHILTEIEMAETEVFPKQDALLPGMAQFGNFINAPLFGALVPKGRTVFVKPDETMKPYPNQWEFLDNIQRVPEALLDEIIEINELARTHIQKTTTTVSLGVFQESFILPPCARNMLANGVTSYQRVACFRLAVHLKKAGLPYELVVAALAEWAKKNKPTSGKSVITYREIKSQAASAFIGNYKGCGCDEPPIKQHCDPSCPIRSRKGTP